MSEISGIDKQPWEDLEVIFLSCNQLITATSNVPSLLQSISSYEISDEDNKKLVSLSNKLTKRITLGIEKLKLTRAKHDDFLKSNGDVGSVSPTSLIDSVKIVDDYTKWIESEGSDINESLVDFNILFEEIIGRIEESEKEQ